MTRPAPNLAGFADAQNSKRQLLGSDVTFLSEPQVTFPPGTAINPDTGDPYDPTIEPESVVQPSVVVRCGVYFRALVRGSGGEAAASPVGWEEATRIFAIAPYSAKAQIDEAIELIFHGAVFKIHTIKDDELVAGYRRVLVYAAATGEDAATSDPPANGGGPGAQRDWAPPGAVPLSDALAAALVTHRAESRPGNATANNYVPSDGELAAFHAAVDDNGDLADTMVAERQHVTGRPGLTNPSTDDLIQWAAHKWGIPEDWIRAQMVQETDWNQDGTGDRVTVSTAEYNAAPAQARIPPSDVYSSLGISQVKWFLDGSQDTGTEPLRWKSTAFALDFYAAKVRYFYNGDCSWCTAPYSAGQDWNSIGAWFEPDPWENTGQEAYISQVQAHLADRPWEQPGF